MLVEAALTHAEENKIHAPEQPWSDSFAAKVVTADFESALNYRRQHEARWANADRLYVGWKRQLVWEGTKIPRSALPIFVTFQQIESLLPKILSAIFSDQPWFEVGPQPGTTAIDAMIVREFMLYQMEMGRRLNNQSVREVFRRCIKSGLLYGNGVAELNWLDIVQKLRKRARVDVPEVFEMMGMQIPTGRNRSQVAENIVEKQYQMPTMDYVSIKDFYIDANCPSPQVQMASHAGKRVLMTADQLKAKRDVDGFKIPNDAALLEMARHTPERQIDIAKATTDQLRGFNWQASQPTSLDPGKGLIEVISDYRKDRCVWIANPGSETQAVLYNHPNELGFIPFFSPFYTDVLDRFYAMSVTDVTEGEHRLQGGILDARIDELSLTIHSARIKRRGSSVSNSQLRRRPGQIIEAENPKEDIVTEQTQNITQQAFIEVSASDSRVQKTTGITDLVGFGVASSGGNSANRTARGVGAQESAAFSRIIYLVENIEDTFVEPILSMWHFMNTLYLDPEQMLKVMGEDVDPLKVMNSDVLFYMRASSKMQSRMALLQTFPLIAQTFMNPALMDQLERKGLTFDFHELWTMLLDMTGYKTRGQFIRKLTDEEKQALEAAKQAEENPELTKQRERMEAMKEMQEGQQDAALEHTIMKTGLEMALEPDEAEGE